jgi:hypothetical protein
VSSTAKTLGEIRDQLDRRLAERKATLERYEQLKRENAEAIRGAERAKRILERA